MRLLLMLILFVGSLSYGQSGFKLLKGKKESLSFNSSANLIIIPATVNGTKMNFILDTGSSKSVIFDLTGVDSLNIKKGRVVKYRGLGSEFFFEAYYSPENEIIVGEKIRNKSGEILIMENKDYSVSERLGIDVNGIIGTDLFQNFIVEIDYVNERVHFFKNDSKLPRRLRNVKYLDMEIRGNKPYINTELINDNSKVMAKMLVDSGSSDALLLHSIDSTNFKLPVNGFDDYLGYGLTGELFGRRSKIDSFKVSNYVLNKTTVSFPFKDNQDIQEFNDTSQGSLGGEILRRFDVIIDYKNSKIAFSPNIFFSEGFYYNMTGIQLKIDGTDLEVSTDDGRWGSALQENTGIKSQVSINNYSIITYKIVPKIIVASVVEGSAAHKAGIRKGDQILRINGRSNENLSLWDANSFFYKNPYSNLKIVYKREDEQYTVKIKLIPIIK